MFRKIAGEYQLPDHGPVDSVDPLARLAVSRGDLHGGVENGDSEAPFYPIGST